MTGRADQLLQKKIEMPIERISIFFDDNDIIRWRNRSPVLVHQNRVAVRVFNDEASGAL